MKFLFLLILITCIFLYYINANDGDYFPYAIKGLDVLVYDKEGEEYFAGHIEANYYNRKDALDVCQAKAHNFAKQRELEEWGYVCCTVTSSSNCKTKVR